MISISKLLQSEKLCLMIILIMGVLTYTYISMPNFGIGVYDDSGSNFFAGENILKGNIDYLRTPVYPLICCFFAWISADYALRMIVVLQLFIFFSSAIPLYFSLKHLTKRTGLSFIITAIYTCFPTFLIYTNLIFTESLAISSTTYLIYFLTAIVFGSHKARSCSAAIILFLFMVMLRPFFICFAPGVAIVILYALYKNKTNKNFVKTTFISGAIALASVVSYCTAYYVSYGKFSFTCVYELNRNLALSKMHLTGPSQGIEMFSFDTKPDINGKSLHIKEAWVWNPTKEYIEECDKAYSENFTRYVKNKIIEFHSSLFMTLDTKIPNSTASYYINLFSHLRIYYIYFLIFAFLLLEVYLLYRDKSNVIISFALITIAVASIFTAIWGADEQYVRIITPMLPCVFVMIGIMFCRFAISLKDSHEK